VLDRDKAYFLVRCVHRVPCTLREPLKNSAIHRLSV
jgi:hypothetical protein